MARAKFYAVSVTHIVQKRGSIVVLAGYTVVEAGDGQKWLDLFRRAGADLVITDIVMPEKEGLEVLLNPFPAAVMLAAIDELLPGRAGPSVRSCPLSAAR